LDNLEEAVPNDAAARATDRAPLDLDSVLPEIDLIGNRGLADQVRRIWATLWERSEFPDFAAVPTSGEIPYPNLPHMRSVVALALGIADTFERFHRVAVDRDVLVAACLLQDASKLVEYRPRDGGGIEKTELGRALPHAFEAARLALEEGVPMAVVHIIATHSPQAPRFPESIEGKIVYYADQLDVIAIHGDHWRKEQVIRRG
jgi:hypothetical protein